MERLCPDDWKIEQGSDGTVLISIESNKGYRHWRRVALSNLANDHAVASEAENAGLDEVHRIAVSQL